MIEPMSTTPLEIRLLGSVEIAGETDKSLGGRTQRRLLAALALSKDSVVSVDQLIDHTWGQDPPARAEHNIRTYVHRLRSVLGDAASIHAVPPGYRLTLHSAVLDIEVFEAHTRTAARLESSGAVVDALGHCDAADRLWRGQPLGEFAYEEWARPEVVRLEELRLSAMERRSELYLAAGSPTLAVTEAQKAIEAAPLGENPHVLLMRGLYACGRTTKALRHFQDYRELLSREVGLEPSDRLAELDRSIARGDAVEPAPGTQRIAGYELLEKIGEGAFAVVHRARQTSLGREVAMKIIRYELASQPAFIRAFENEARSIARIEHPNVVPLYDYWRDPDQAYLIMRYMPGGSLADRLERGPLSPNVAVDVVDSIAAALTAAHSVGLVHRDVKPANILFDTDGTALLADFGIAIDLGNPEVSDGAGSGSSARYAAPELLSGESGSGPRADVYGLAAVAFATLTGSDPWAAATSQDQLSEWKQRMAAPESVVQGEPLTDRLVEVLTRGTSPDPGLRHASVAEFAAAFRAATSGEEVAVPSVAAGVNPYQGLRAFDEADASLFFGRDTLIDQVVQKLSIGSALAVVGPSGSGKSSLVRAGLLPAVRSGRIEGSDDWFITSMTPGAHPFEALEVCLLRVAVNPPTALLDQLQDGERGILRALQRIIPGPGDTVLLFIDQFEELFTNVADPSVTTAFLDALSSAVSEPDSPLRLVITLRADFFDRPLRHATFAAVLKQATVAVTPPSPAEIEQVITQPARAAGIEFEPGLVAQIISDVSDQPGALPLLQFSLTRAFDHSDNTLITRSDYDSLGGLGGAIRQQADELYERSTMQEQALLRRVMGRLVALGEGTEDTRRRVLRSELGDSEHLEPVLARFGGARLLTFDHDPGSREPTVEVAHEELVRSWPRLRGWLDEDRSDLQTMRRIQNAAVDWDRVGRPDTDLYRGGRLETAEQWATDSPEDVGVLEGEFLEASSKLAADQIAAEQQRFDQQVQMNRRLRRLVTGVAVLLVCALIAGAVALEQRETARGAAFDAETDRLVSTVAAIVDKNPRAALLVAVAAYQREQTPETLGALQVALSQSGPLLGTLGFGTDYFGVGWTGPNRLVGIRETGIDLYDVDGRTLLDSIDIQPYSETSLFGLITRTYATASQAPRIGAIVGDRRTAIVYDADNSIDEVFSVSSVLPIRRLALSPAGDVAATITEDGTLTLWDDDGEAIFTRPNDELLQDQAIRLLGDDSHPFVSTFVGPLSPASFAQAVDDHLVVSIGAEVLRFTWAGEQVGPTASMRTTPAETPSQPFVWYAKEFSTGSDGSIYLSASDRFGVLRPGETVANLHSLLGRDGARVLLVNRFDGDDESSLALFDNGSIQRIDHETRELELITDPQLGNRRAEQRPGEPNVIAVAGVGGITLLTIDGGGPLTSSVPRNRASPQVSLSHDGEYVVAGGTGANSGAPTELWKRDGTRWLRDSRFDDQTHFWADATPTLANGLALIVEGDGFTIREVWTLHEAPHLSLSTPAGSQIFAADAVRDGSLEALGYRDVAVNSIEVNDPSIPPMEIARFPLPGDAETGTTATNLRFSPDETRLLSAESAGNAELRDTSTWEHIPNEIIDNANISLGFWNESGTLLATASTSGVITIRDGQSYEPIRTMVGAVGVANSFFDGELLLSRDGTVLLSNIDGTPRLWDVETGQQIGTAFPTYPGTIAGANFGETLQLATASKDHALVWNLDTDLWPDIACRTASSNLTKAEWEQWGPRDQDYSATCTQFDLPPQP